MEQGPLGMGKEGSRAQAEVQILTAGGSIWLGRWEIDRGGGCGCRGLHGDYTGERTWRHDSRGPSLHDEIKSRMPCCDGAGSWPWQLPPRDVGHREVFLWQELSRAVLVSLVSTFTQTQICFS